MEMQKKKGHPAPPHKAKLQPNAADSRMVNVYKRLKTDGASNGLGEERRDTELSPPITGEHGCNIREMEMQKKKGASCPAPQSKITTECCR
jgi:hypothetical protein